MKSGTTSLLVNKSILVFHLELMEWNGETKKVHLAKLVLLFRYFVGYLTEGNFQNDPISLLTGMAVQALFKVDVSFLPPFFQKLGSLLTFFCYCSTKPGPGVCRGRFRSGRVGLAASNKGRHSSGGLTGRRVPLRNTPVAAGALVPSSDTWPWLCGLLQKQRSHLGPRKYTCKLLIAFLRH